MFWFFGHEARGILAPQPGIEPAPTALEGKVSATGLPGKPLTNMLLKISSIPDFWWIEDHIPTNNVLSNQQN